MSGKQQEYQSPFSYGEDAVASARTLIERGESPWLSTKVTYLPTLSAAEQAERQERGREQLRKIAEDIGATLTRLSVRVHHLVPLDGTDDAEEYRVAGEGETPTLIGATINAVAVPKELPVGQSR